MLVEAVFPQGKYLFRDNNKNIKTTSMDISKLHTKVLSGYSQIRQLFRNPSLVSFKQQNSENSYM